MLPKQGLKIFRVFCLDFLVSFLDFRDAAGAKSGS